MRFRFSKRAESDAIVELCFTNVDLLNEYRRKKRRIDAIQIIFSLLWLAFVFVLAFLFPEEEADFIFTPLTLGVITSIIVVIFVVQIIWNAQKSRLFQESERLLPRDEDGTLRRRLIESLRGYYKFFTLIVGVGYLLALGLILIVNYIWGESLLSDIFCVALVILPTVPTIIFSMRFTRERAEIVRQIELKQNTFYKNSDIYKN